jgi:ribose 5-phosphate isomerase B
MQLALAADHAGYELKTELRAWLQANGHQVQDFGTDSDTSCDYPDYAHPLADAVEQRQAELGIVVCGSGNGVCMAANKHPGVRAALAWRPDVAALARQHNDANVLCLPARFITAEDAIQCVNAFLSTAFEGGRHQRRIDKITGR